MCRVVFSWEDDALTDSHTYFGVVYEWCDFKTVKKASVYICIYICLKLKCKTVFESENTTWESNHNNVKQCCFSVVRMSVLFLYAAQNRLVPSVCSCVHYSCEAIDCQEPLIRNAEVKCSDGGYFNGARCTVTCNSGYVLQIHRDDDIIKSQVLNTHKTFTKNL